MGQIENLFFENPTKEFHIRGIAKLLKIPKTTVSYKINQLIKENIVIKDSKGIFPSYRPSQNEIYKFKKRQHFLEKLFPLLNHLENELNPKCIILFGSFAKAEYDKDSDIDIFIQAKEHKIKLTKFEKQLKHKINILFENNLNNLSKELLNNIINGVKLRGFIRL
ncbi:hypothetical protein COV16_04140 [Candidatus Woesearchaeota archaeon CG10_big_fil_rev_8_21_14_0_10_34_8]|nr:MAG: hypothetical protein COV16_04140 [Candidatus Woesearchaeota archaeon CG10_big_fil_rev_8_21_14_0_10_34_8]